jgi:uncharacterized membrane protein
MSDEVKVRCNSANGGVIAGPVWAVGWLFTIGFLHLAFWKAALAIVLWPYYLGIFFGK